MALCVTVDGSGVLTGTPTAVESCVGYVLLSPTEYAEVMSQPAWSLSAADGALIAVSILTAWALGWSFRAIASVLQSTDEVNENA